MLPPLTDVNRPFWTGGADGQLLILRCSGCGRWVHPPSERCPSCAGDLTPQAVSGYGTVFTYTVNAHRFHPAVTPPYTIAIVQLDEQDDLRIPTNLVNHDDAELRCGMRVRVLFEQHAEIFVPLFEPVGSAR